MNKSWLNINLAKKIKSVFEPRYGHNLSDDKITTVATNLVDALEVISKFTWRYSNEHNNIRKS